jgi:hypothetical protein
VIDSEARDDPLRSPEIYRKHIGEWLLAVTGECFCGAISYVVSGDLRDARSCHCSRCRKAFSGQASAYALVNPDEFKWLKGEEQLASYVGSHGAGLQFCSNCGSTLCGVVDGQVHGVTLGCVNGDPDIEIGYHIFVGSRARWEVIPDGVITYEGAAPEN